MSQPIFVVGAPRSGTTLLAAMLGTHPDYAAGPESQFFSKLAPQSLEHATTEAFWPAHAVDLVAGLTLAEQPVLKLFETDRDGIHDYLSSREPSVSAMLESLTVPFARSRNKVGWIEKTPNHILNVAEIRANWPEAAIIRIVRDPRDSALSTCKLPTFSSSVYANLYLWRQWHAASARFFKSDTRCATLKYEDLVQHPERELQALCETIGISYDPAMLEFTKSAADVSSANESWKSRVSSGLDPSRILAWKNSLAPEACAVAELICYEWLTEFEYEVSQSPLATHTIFRMSPRFIEEFEPVIVRDAQEGIRWLSIADPSQAEFVVEPPEYGRFDKPYLYLRMAKGRWFVRREIRRARKY